MSEFLFSYGTLIPEHAPPEVSSVTSSFRPYADGWVPGALYDLGEYPGAVLNDHAKTKVFGTVFLVPDKQLFARLDDYEGFDPHDVDSSLFRRRKYLVRLMDGRKLNCWVYEYNQDPAGAPTLSSGRYRERMSPPQKQAI